MRSDAPLDFARFVRRLHRRLIVVRLLECAAIGLGCAAGLSILLLPLVIMRHEPALPLPAFLLPLGAMTGACWLLPRRPRVIDAAAEADRQLGLADLLATAWVIARSAASSGDPFERAVLLTANVRTASLSPYSVVLNRLGVRAWTGIGLASALAITLALLSANPIISHADSRGGAVRKTSASPATERAQGSSQTTAGPRSTPTVADDPNQQEENGFNPARRTTRAAGDANDSSDGAESADPTGAGGGAGRSRSPAEERLANATSSSNNTDNAGSTSGAGGGATAAARGSGGEGSTLSAGDTFSGRNAPPWTTAAWPAARSAATNAVRSGAVPSQYHDLVRSYFDRGDGQR